MIIKLTLKPETELVLPLNYNYYIQSMIYRVLQDVPEYSRFLHDCGYSGGGSNGFRIFTFSGFNSLYKIKNKMIIFHGIMKLEIRSASEEFTFHLKNALSRRDKLIFKGQPADIISVEMTKHLILPYSINVHTVSPVVASRSLDNGYTQYFSPADNDFEGIVNNNFKKKFSAFYNITPLDDINIINKSSNPKHIITKYNGTIINAYHSSFILNGNPQYLQFLYDTGLGSKNAQGFGMFEIDE